MYILGWRLHCIILCIPQRGENSPQEAKRLVHNHISLAQKSKHSDYESSALCFQYMLKKQPEELRTFGAGLLSKPLHCISFIPGRKEESLLRWFSSIGLPTSLIFAAEWIGFLVLEVFYFLWIPVTQFTILVYYFTAATVDFYFESITFTHFPSMGLLTLPRNCLPHSHDLGIFLAIFNTPFLTLCD